MSEPMSDNDRLIDQACDMYCHGIARIDTLGPNRRPPKGVNPLGSARPLLRARARIGLLIAPLADSGRTLMAHCSE